ncbi:hypothetical protein AN2V17_13030 [Vallitalea sp. AN17-2]|uniref:Uncharacterized protein n=1 Tax=Vallitalea maricola TaxID=3074433 RepID=A0ACB5UGT6_9FIRM|nr:hypothetical protein AN2V17_13030 [Vallitalea sp. AN17-2]
MCGYVSAYSACGGRCRNTKERIYEIAVFTRALKDFKFVKNGRDFKSEVPIGEFKICIALRDYEK